MSNNVFADLELSNPEERLLKADLVLAIRKMTADAAMTQAQIADRVGMAQPHVSRMLSGMTKDISVERLLRVIIALGSDVCISIEGAPQSIEGASQGAEGARRGHFRVSGAGVPLAASAV